MFQYMSGAKNVEGDNVLSLIEKREKVRYNVISMLIFGTNRISVFLISIK